jgi:hypothetical protein
MIEEAVHIQFQSGGAARPHTQTGSSPWLSHSIYAYIRREFESLRATIKTAMILSLFVGEIAIF